MSKAKYKYLRQIASLEALAADTRGATEHEREAARRMIKRLRAVVDPLEPAVDMPLFANTHPLGWMYGGGLPHLWRDILCHVARRMDIGNVRCWDDPERFETVFRFSELDREFRVSAHQVQAGSLDDLLKSFAEFVKGEAILPLAAAGA